MPPKANQLRIKKPKLLRSNPYRLSSIKFLDIDPSDLPDDEDILVSIHRPTKFRFKPIFDDDVEDHIAKRLEQARMLAMKAYREKRAQSPLFIDTNSPKCYYNYTS